ncbi:MAG: hypothetical protein EOL88_02355 [Bacteroidia bacterium]|nr:hypothetical protein [Bacteroidia bacterium]
MTRTNYEFEYISNILDDFINILKEELIIYEGDLILYHNKYDLKANFFDHLSFKIQAGHYEQDEAEVLIDKLSILVMALQSNLIQLGMSAKNPSWYIYISRVKFGWEEGSGETKNRFKIIEGSNKTEQEILQEAEILETKQLQTKN